MTKQLFLGLAAIAILTGCGSSSADNSNLQSTAIRNAVCESSLTSGMDCTLTINETILATIDANATESIGNIGIAKNTSFPLVITTPTNLNLCFTGIKNANTLSIYQNGNLLGSMSEQAAGYNCASNAPTIFLIPGNYTLTLTADPSIASYQTFELYMQPSSGLTGVTSVSATNMSLEVTSVPAYNSNSSYGANNLVSYEGNIYESASWAEPGMCPIKANCPIAYKVGTADEVTWTIWKEYNPAVKHEFVHYDYSVIFNSAVAGASTPLANFSSTLATEYGKLPACTQAQYALTNVQSVIDASVASGEISKAAPQGGFKAADNAALYREYMLPCQPNINSSTPTSSLPANVQTIMSVMPLSTWQTFASNTGAGDLKQKTYSDANRNSQPWPAQTDFISNAYYNFLNAAARYPYFCGEQGYFSSSQEACKREIASLLGHAAQETGNGDVTQSFYWFREFGYVNGTSFFSDGCSAPFTCNNNFERYYGRGPKQLTYYYNYAGFSASYFNGDYQFLLSWPDYVASDGIEYFASAIWFVMMHQPPKPSIHDVILGLYKPSQTCVTGSESGCYGIQYDAVSGVKNNFDVTIEVVNGGPECRGQNAAASANRTSGYLKVLNALGANLTQAENSLPKGCNFIANSGAPGTASIFAYPNLSTTTNTWVDMSGVACQAQSKGGSAMISVTAPGIVNACRKAKGLQ